MAEYLNDVPRNPNDVPRNPNDVPRNPNDVPRNPNDVPRNPNDVPRKRKHYAHTVCEYDFYNGLCFADVSENLYLCERDT